MAKKGTGWGVIRGGALRASLGTEATTRGAIWTHRAARLDGFVGGRLGGVVGVRIRLWPSWGAGGRVGWGAAVDLLKAVFSVAEDDDEARIVSRVDTVVSGYTPA
jgi:hypothetical protein